VAGLVHGKAPSSNVCGWMTRVLDPQDLPVERGSAASVGVHVSCRAGCGPWRGRGSVRSTSVIEGRNSRCGVESTAVPSTMCAAGTHAVHIGPQITIAHHHQPGVKSFHQNNFQPRSGTTNDGLIALSRRSPGFESWRRLLSKILCRAGDRPLRLLRWVPHRPYGARHHRRLSHGPQSGRTTRG
jgi:hypothetical protein